MSELPYVPTAHLPWSVSAAKPLFWGCIHSLSPLQTSPRSIRHNQVPTRSVTLMGWR